MPGPLIDGKMGPVKEPCTTHAMNAFKSRSGTDTNPKIVQMVLYGQPVPHYYYRSDEFIDQPFFHETQFLEPYVGPTNEANPILYGDGTYIENETMTSLALKSMTL
jgi:hypothetical protein